MKENSQFLKEQIITYLGNKRSLINLIENEIKIIQTRLGNEKTTNLDLFSGSGIVARMMKKYSKKIIVNDLEKYSYILNDCYLTNQENFDEEQFNQYLKKILYFVNNSQKEGIFSKYYAPRDTLKIRENERVFFTRENALLIDSIIYAINKFIPEKFKKFFLGPLITEVSIKNNTSGVFKGFYKDKKTGFGKFGGTGEYALKRIMGKIKIEKPVLSNFDSEIEIYNENANDLVKKIENIDITYLDPPYNQHPYGSNYFMLNLVIDNKIDSDISKISGIPINWNRSKYNMKNIVLIEFDNLISNLNSRFIIISYNSEGLMKLKNIKQICEKYGSIEIKEIPYITYRGSRNLSERNLYVIEYLIILEKRL